MKYSTALTLASVAIGVQAQGAPTNLTPQGSAPAGCVASGTGTYQINIIQPAPTKRNLVERAACDSADALVVSLNNGVLTDRQGRIGAIVANRQFQFDGPPPQAGSIYTAGWSICGNTSLALGPSAVFYRCRSGNFFNLYDQPSESECSLIHLTTTPCGGSSGTPSGGGVSQSPDGQPTATSAASASPSQISDGQVQASSAPVTQISDGQVQATTSAAVSQISDGQVQATSAANATVTTSPPIATGAAIAYGASGAVVAAGAALAAFFL